MTLSIDFETFSSVDIQTCGSYAYMDSPDFEILLLSYAFDGAAVRTVDLCSGEPWPQDFLYALKDQAVTKTAWNCAFERNAIYKALGFYCDPSEWEDSMILAAQCGLPMTLDAASKALKLPEDTAKMKEGKALIRYFSTPCKPTKANGQRKRNMPWHAPEKWNLYKKYNATDVVAERAIRNTLLRWKPGDTEHRFWVLDAKINERGVRIDKTFASQAVHMDALYKSELTDRAITLTGLENPNSVKQVKAWLQEQEDVGVPSLNKKVVADVVAGLRTDVAKEFMAIRSELSKTSTKKYEAMLRYCGGGEYARGCFRFYGANRTGRFAGRGVQFQNLAKNSMDTLDDCRQLVRLGRYDAVKALYGGVTDQLSELIRTAIIPEDGCKIMVADFSAIEARVIAWIAGEQWRLDVFQNGGDIYCASASQMFHVPVEKHGVNGELRQKGKIAELALGYGGGVNALKAFGADKMGMSEEEMQETVDLWRAASPNICALWKDVERAAIRCIVHKRTVVSPQAHIRFDLEKGILWMTLPSGRRIAYWDAAYEPSTLHPGRKAISYMGVDQHNKWSRIETWGGKLVENLVQATARDCLREAMFALDTAGFDIRAHVHDEVIVSEPIGGRTVEEMSTLMGQPIPWAEGLPLRADGYEGAYYFKD